MASPCIITLDGKEYSYADYMAMLHDGGLDALVKSGVVQVGEMPKTKLQSAKEKLQSLKAKKNESNQLLKSSVDPFKEAEEKAKLDREIFDAYVDVAKEYIKEVGGDINSWAKDIGEDITDQLKAAWEVANGAVKKTIQTKRAYEGTFREGVKAELEKLGLTREIENQAEAESRAKEFVNTVGEDAALEAVRNGDVVGGEAAAVFADIMLKNRERALLSTDEAEVQRLNQREAELINEFGKMATQGGQFNAMINRIYQTTDLGFSVEKKIQEYKDVNNGEIPAEVEAKFRALDKELKEVNKKLAEAEKRAADSEANKAIQGIKESISRSKKRDKKEEAKVLIGEGLSDLADALGVKLSVVGDKRATIVQGLTKIGRGLILNGEATVENVAQKVKEYVDSRFKGKINFNDYADDFAKEILVEEKTDGQIKVKTSMLRDLVERGIDNIDDLVAAVKENIKIEYPNATDRQIRDAITGYGKVVNPSQDTISKQLRKMKDIGRIISALEDVEKKKRPLKSGQQRDKLDAEQRALRKELREAMKDLPMDEAEAESMLKTQLEATKNRIRNQIEDLQSQIDLGEKTPESAKTFKEDEELRSLKEKRDALKEEYDKIFKDEEFMEQKRLEQAKKRIQQRIDELKKKIQKGDFDKKESKPVIADTELTKLKAEKLRIQEEYDKEMYKAKLKNRTTSERMKDTAWELWGIPRALMATGEASFVGVQGLKQTIAHPLSALKAFKTAWSFLKSEKNADAWLRNIKSQDWYPIAKEAKLAITEPSAEITAREELFYSGWTNILWDTIGKIATSPARLKSKDAYQKAQEIWNSANPLKASERAAIGYLDTLRVERFLDGMQILEMQGKTPQNNKQDYKDVADAINTMTGRASLGSMEQNAQLLSKVFFSPRNWASGIKTATPYALYHFGKMTPTARKMALADMSKMVGLTTGMVMMAASQLNNDDDPETSVEFDPRSTDFMKIKLGDIRVDPWGGMQQQVVFSSRMIADALMKGLPQLGVEGAIKKDGKIMPLGIPNKTKTARDLAMEQAVNKLNPVASVINDFATSRINKKGKLVNAYGEEMSFKSELSDKYYPIFWGTVSDLLKDDPTALDGLLIFYAFWGGGVNKYSSKKKEKATQDKSEDNPTPSSRFSPNVPPIQLPSRKNIYIDLAKNKP